MDDRRLTTACIFAALALVSALIGYLTAPNALSYVGGGVAGVALAIVAALLIRRPRRSPEPPREP